LQSEEQVKELLEKYLFKEETKPGARAGKLRNLLSSIVGQAAAAVPKTFGEMTKLMEALLRDALMCQAAMQCKSKNSVTMYIFTN